MVHYNNIPLEIWVNVFRFIEQPRHLLECRLVCKKWNCPAETAMFSKHLHVSKSNSISKLCDHLAKHPSRAHLVNYLNVYSHGAEYDSESEILKLIKVAFNPNLKYWGAGGDPVDSKAISTVLEIIEGLPKDTVYQLQTMPESSIENDENYAKLGYIMRNTLTFLSISATRRPMNTYLQKLAVFRYLTELKLDAEELESIAELDSILKNCPHLTFLDLVSPMNDNYVELDRDVLANWMTKNVNKVNSLTDLAVDLDHPDLIEYLVYKYPKVETIDFQTIPAPFQHNHVSRLFTALKNITDFTISYFFDQHQELLNSIPTIFDMHEEGTNISAEIFYEHGMYHDSGAELALGTLGDLTDFSVVVPNNLSARVHAEILDQIHALNDNHKLLRLKIKMLSLEPVVNDGIMTFHQILSKFPTLTYLVYEWKQIKFERMETKTDLTRLQIFYAEIDAKVFPQISKLCPNLRYLDLVDCSIVDNEKHPDKVYKINLPNTSLRDLSVRVPPNTSNYGTRRSHIESMITQNTVTGDCYLKVSVLEGNMHVYHRFNSTDKPVVLTQAEFEARPRRPEDATFFVTCALILNLNFNIANISFDINLKESVLNYVSMTDSEKLRLQMQELAIRLVNDYAGLDDAALLNKATKAIGPFVDGFKENGIALILLARKLAALENERMAF